MQLSLFLGQKIAEALASRSAVRYLKERQVKLHI